MQNQLPYPQKPHYLRIFSINNFFIQILKDIFSYEFYYKNIIDDAIPNNYSKYKSLLRHKNNLVREIINFNAIKELGISKLSLIISEALFNEKLSLHDINLQKAFLLSNKHLSYIAKTNNIHMKNDKENANLIKILIGMIFLDQYLQHRTLKK